MFQVKCPPWLLLVASLLMVSCPSAEQGARCGGDAVFGELETFDYTFNSTDTSHFAYGITANLVAVLLYGSSFVPIKRTETGDGNIAVVPIVKAIGLGLGSLIWGSSSLLMGWASSKFGWFGIDPQDVSRPILNYCGAGLCLLSGLIFFFVKADVDLHPNSESIPLLIDRRTYSGSYGPTASEFWIDQIGQKTRRVIGCLLAVVSGLLYGSSFAPILYIKSHSSCQGSLFSGASDYDLDYVYAQCSGIFVTSTVYFTVYCVAMRNRPRIYSRLILPGLLSGLMWALATYCWFLANNYLSAVVTFPIVTAGYGLVAALWGSLVFKEIKGRANCCIFFLASCVVLTGSSLTAISKL
ncbi:transmembrane protein 144b isoform X2 [Hippoglossus hippoglossus]|uniref:transmembrane protein 144b isoform X2 n=1 Tax=Hippoglossus hippoglossus TaxID=8267 RepID=UPI00148B48FD|nr:transmembrane protein 144b isoform X2 [Hippoglossus hippoglossus]